MERPLGPRSGEREDKGRTADVLLGPRGAATRARILEASALCVRRWGIRRLSMNDVARQAGVSRRTVYMYFPDRDALVEAVLEAMAAALVQAIAPDVRRRATLAEQVAEAAVRIHALLPAEAELGLGRRPGESVSAAMILVRCPRVVRAWLAFWRPLVEAARDRGEIRADIDVDTAAEWIMRMHVSLVTFPAQTFDAEDPEQVRRYVQAFVPGGFAS